MNTPVADVLITAGRTDSLVIGVHSGHSKQTRDLLATTVYKSCPCGKHWGHNYYLQRSNSVLFLGLFAQSRTNRIAPRMYAICTVMYKTASLLADIVHTISKYVHIRIRTNIAFHACGMPVYYSYTPQMVSSSVLRYLYMVYARSSPHILGQTESGRLKRVLLS